MSGVFRFGVNMMAPGERAGWVDKCRRAEDLGYDVVCVADHLGMPAPFPALVLAAEVTERPKLCPFVLNAAFYNPVLLAREITTVRDFLGGRLELGLGAGYAKPEFDEAGIPWESGGRRIDRMVAALDALGAPGCPLLIGGWGDRMLRLAAERADIVAFTGAGAQPDGSLSTLAGAPAFRERVEFVRAALGEREAELNVLIQFVDVTADRRGSLERLRPYAPELSAEELGELPTLLVGTAEQIAEQLREQREKLGLTYISVMERDFETFAPVIELLR